MLWAAVDSLLSGVNSTSLVIFLLCFLLTWCYLSTRPLPNMPPGPSALPFVGNLLSIRGGNLLEQVRQWRQQYGDIFTIKMGSKRVVMINSYKLAHEAFVKNGDVFSGRPLELHVIHEVIKKTGKGVIFSEGPVWKALRRVTLTTMRSFGVGKKSMEERVHEEARAVVQVLMGRQGEATHLKPLINRFSSNVICSIILGSRFEYDDPVFLDLLSKINDLMRVQIIFTPTNFISLAKFVPYFRKLKDSVVNTFVSVDRMIEKILKEHEETYDPDNIRDFVDLYIQTREESKDSHLYNASNMRRVIIDLFVAGTETTATFVDWALLFLIDNPSVQERCQQDIDRVAGQSRMVTLEDRKELPYIEAVITEVLRIGTIAAFSIPHMAVRDGSIAGYSLPEGTMVLTNVRSIHLDPSLWPDPHAFSPERYLDSDGKFCSPKENHVPFSLGPRQCMGELLARTEIFLLLTSLLQSFTFSLAQGQRPDLQGHMGVTFSAKPQPVIATPR